MPTRKRRRARSGASASSNGATISARFGTAPPEAPRLPCPARTRWRPRPAVDDGRVAGSGDPDRTARHLHTCPGVNGTAATNLQGPQAKLAGLGYFAEFLAPAPAFFAKTRQLATRRATARPLRFDSMERCARIEKE